MLNVSSVEPYQQFCVTVMQYAPGKIPPVLGSTVVRPLIVTKDPISTVYMFICWVDKSGKISLSACSRLPCNCRPNVGRQIAQTKNVGQQPVSMNELIEKNAIIIIIIITSGMQYW